MDRYIKVKIPETKKQFSKWSLGFSAKVLTVVFILWGISIIFCMFVIAYALMTTGNIAEPVNFMHEVNSTFGTAVIGILITRTVGNVFQYNDGSIFGKSRKEDNNDSTGSGIFTDDLLGDDGANRRGD